MAAQQMPAAEVEVTEHLVRGLLTDQHPDLADRPLTIVATGWDNVVFRLGDDLSVRVPRRQMAADLVLNEQRWLPDLARRLPIPVPAPVRIGAPGRDYPWAWSVCPWFHGAMAADVALAEPQREAERLGAFVEALHRAAPADAPTNVALRGRPLAELSDRFDLHLARDVVPDARAADERWRELTAVEPWRGPATWVHGDLHTANVLVDRGAICAVIDFGDVTAGDPAVDLAIAWMLFDGDHREVFRSCAGAGDDDALWLRAEGWALYFAVVYLANSADNPRFTRIGRDLLANVLPPANSRVG